MKRPYSEKLFEMLPLPTLAQWSKMSHQTRLELYHSRENDYKAAGFKVETAYRADLVEGGRKKQGPVVTFTGISKLAFAKGYGLSRKNSQTLEWIVRDGSDAGYWSEDSNLKPAERELGTWLRGHMHMPMNVLKAKFKADTSAAMAAHFSPQAKADRFFRKYHYFQMSNDSSYAWEFTKACMRGEFDAVEADYPVTFSEAHKAEFERLQDEYDARMEK